MSRSSNKVSKALSETMLVVPGNKLDLVKAIMASIESKLNEFKDTILEMRKILNQMRNVIKSKQTLMK